MDSKGKEMMYCPMKFNIHCYYGDDLPGDCPAGKTWECEKEKCAWWIDWSERCAINQIAQGFYIDKEMNENPTRNE